MNIKSQNSINVKSRTSKILAFISILILSAIGKVNAQTFDIYIANDTVKTATTLEFDVYIRNTGVIAPWALRSYQSGYQFDAAFVAGGTLSGSYIAGTSELEATFSKNWGFTYSGATNRVVNQSSNTGSSCPGAIINTGTKRIGRFRITNTVAFGCAPHNIRIMRAGAGFLSLATSRYNTTDCSDITPITNTAGATSSAPPSTLYTQVNNMKPMIVTQPAATATMCAGAGSTQFSVDAIGNGTASAVSYQWMDNGSPITNDAIFSGATTNTLTITNPTAGMDGHSYTCVVSQCTPAITTTTTAGVLTVNAPDAPAATPTHATCLTPTGSITVTSSTTGLSFSINGTDYTNTTGVFTGLTPGSYNLTARDGAGCTSEITPVTINAPASVSVSTTQVNVLCFGATTGSATVTPSGGTEPYTYSWSPSGGNAATASNLAAGTYTVTVTDATGCTGSTSVTITQPASAVVANESHTQATCGGSSTVTITGSGGVGPYLGEGTFNLPAGNTATYTVTDANGCSAQVTVTATIPGGPVASIVSQTNVLCFGQSTGSATASATGGAGSYTYSWSPSGGNAATATGLAAGTYTVTVTDASNCTDQETVTITGPASALTAEINGQSNVLCFGQSTGAASVVATGGTGSYTYSWSPSGGTAASATGLAAGTYVVTITDANLCSTTVTIIITEPASAVSAAVNTQTNVLCFGQSTGSATVTASGGTAPYTYSWSPSGGTAATASGLAAGTYTVTVTDDNLCTTTASVTITEPALLVASESHTPIACGGISTVTISATGGTGSYTGTGTFSQPAGTVVYTVTDANNCTATVSVTVAAPGSPTAAINTQTNVSCFGGSNGSATVTATGGNGVYSYSWSPSGGSAATATGLAAGTYTVTVTDGNNCTTTASVTITEPSAISTSTSQVNVLCNGSATGSATVTPTGGTGAYTYSWSPSGGTAATATGLTAGTYTVTVTDANLCTTTASVTITEPATAVSASITAQTNVTCFNSTDGAATVTASGGTGAYTYSWSPSGGTAATATGLAPGTYTVTVTDANLCSTTATVTITAPAQPAAPTYTTVQPTCTTPTGTINVTSPAPAAGITYFLNGGNSNTTGEFTGVASGTHSITYTNSDGCLSFATSVVIDPQPPTPPTPVINVINNNNGTYTLAVAGPPAGTFLWSTGSTASSIIISISGTYTVTHTGTNGCTSPAASYTFNGSITADPAVIGTYFTDMSDVIVNPNSLAAGSSYKINVPLFNLSQDNILPAHSTTLVIDLGSKMTLSGPLGTPLSAYFTWTSTVSGLGHTIITGDQFAQIPPDFIDMASFNVIVTTPCTSTIVADWLVDNHASALVLTDEDINNNNTTIQYASPVSVSATPVNVTCFGEANGDITTVASPGTTIIVTDASNQVVTAPFGPGTYTVTAVASGDNPVGSTCTASTTVTITEPASALTATSTGTNVSCFNGNDGTATATGAGGTGPTYTYEWNTVPAQFTATATNLIAGTYTCVVTDENGCTTTTTYTVTQPTAMTASATGTNVNCFGAATGTATVISSGGTGAHTYVWMPGGQTTPTATGLAAGTYIVTVTDENNCSVQAAYTVTQPAAALAASASGTNVICFGTATGTATVTATGGTAPYTYSWSPSGGTAAIATGLSAGIYTVTVTDALGCTTTATYEVTQPVDGLSATITPTHVSCFNGTNGSATAAGVNGTAPYTYSWNTTPIAQTTATATNLIAGTYTVTVTDAQGCTFSISTTITQPPVLTSTGTSTNVTCFGAANGTASVTPTGGTPGYTYTWSSSSATTSSVTGLAPGIHTVTITDSKGCQRQQSFTITQPAVLSATASTVNVTCNGTATGSATVTPSGGTAPYTYSWSPSGGTAATATGLAAGTYQVTITDSKLCTFVLNVNVTQPAVLNATASGTNVSCFGNSTGTATVSATGGTAPYTYSWSPSGGTAATATGLAAGTYTVTVTDSKGCTKQAIYIVTQPAAALTAAMSSTNVICFGAANGTATATVSGGTAPYSYSWNTTPVPQTTSTATALAPGTYTVTVTDSRGCITTGTAIITQPTGGLVASATGTNVTCFGFNNGTATASQAGGTGPFTYSWSPSGGTAATATGLAPGMYTVTITDAGGCTSTASYTVTQPANALAVTTSNIVNNPCHNGAEGSVKATATGGTLPYVYTITGGNTTGASSGVFTGLIAGVYTITVTDANLCVISTSPVTITHPAGVNPDISLGSDYTDNFFPANGTSQTILYSIAEVGGNPATGDTIRIIKPSGYTFSFNNTSTSAVIGVTTYTLDNPNWKIDNSNPSFVSIIYDPAHNSTPGTIYCGAMKRVTVVMTRNTPNISTFSLSSRLRRCDGEVNLANNLNSILFTSE